MKEIVHMEIYGRKWYNTGKAIGLHCYIDGKLSATYRRRKFWKSKWILTYSEKWAWIANSAV